MRLKSICLLIGQPPCGGKMPFHKTLLFGIVREEISLADVGGELLMISQFTLYANCKKGYRPSFIEAGKPDMANELYEYICEECKKSVPVVEKGIFGAHMHVSLMNDGPFTIILDSRDL